MGRLRSVRLGGLTAQRPRSFHQRSDKLLKGKLLQRGKSTRNLLNYAFTRLRWIPDEAQ
jgi:hypothetical protein